MVQYRCSVFHDIYFHCMWFPLITFACVWIASLFSSFCWNRMELIKYLNTNNLQLRKCSYCSNHVGVHLLYWLYIFYGNKKNMPKLSGILAENGNLIKVDNNPFLISTCWKIKLKHEQRNKKLLKACLKRRKFPIV